MKFCPNCGTQNQDNATVCSQCQTYLAPFYSYPQKHKIKSSAKTIHIFGTISGIISIILGIITVCISPISSTLMDYILDEGGMEAMMVVNMLLSPLKIISFAAGSLLIVFGLFIILYFASKRKINEEDN